jgi:CheY-like chemotaxis protein
MTETILQTNPEDTAASKIVLVVEDDEFNAFFIGEVLAKTKLRLLFAQDGAEAIQQALTQPVDLVLMDIGLPDMSGYDVVVRILEKKPQLKIIAQTAYAGYNDKKTALESGCLDYISKPLDQRLLLSMVSHYLSK